MNICSYSPTKYLDDKGYNDRLRFLFKNVCFLLGQGGGGGSVSSVGLSMPSAFSVAGSPVTTSGTLAVTGAGTTSQYIRGDGSLGSSLPSALTPTWQQVLTAGSTLTGNNTIATAGFNFIFDNVGVFRVNKSSILRLYADGTSSIVNSPDGNSTISVGNNNINIAPDGLGHGIVVTSSTTYIGNLANSSTQDRLVGQTSSSSILGYITLGAGLSLSSGVLNTSGTVPTPISSLTAATGANSIANGAFQQTWSWDGLTNNSGIRMLSNSTTAAGGQTLLSLLVSGANTNPTQTTYGIDVRNTHTGTSSTNYGINALATGATTNFGGSFSATGGTTNNAIQLDGGDIVSTQSTQNVFNTTSTTVNAFGAATTLTIGGTPTTAITHNYSTNATAAATTKTINFGTGGAAGSTTNINVGDADGGTTTVNSPTLAAKIITGTSSANVATFTSTGYSASTIRVTDPDGSMDITNSQIKALAQPLVLNANASYIGLQVGGVEKANLTTGGVFKVKQLAGYSSTPSIAGGAGAGTTPTVSITGTDLAGQITVTTDGDPITSAVFCTVTFVPAFGTSPYVIITPANQNAADDINSGAILYINSTTTTFTINTNSLKAPAASTEIKYHYQVIQ